MRPQTTVVDTPGSALLVLPSVGLVILIIGTGLASLVLTSVGLQPLFGPARLSGAGYAAAASDLLTGVRESLLVAGSSTAAALGMGLPLGLLLRGAAVGARGGPLRAAVAAVVASPHLVGATGVALLLSSGGLGARLFAMTETGFPAFVGGRWPVATVLVFAWKESAFVALVVAAAVGSRVEELSEAARVLGATRRQRLGTITLPLAAPAAVAAGAIVFVYSLGAYEVAWLLGPASPESLPVLAYRLYGSIDLASRPQAAATAVTSVTLAFAAAVAVVPVLRRLAAAR